MLPCICSVIVQNVVNTKKWHRRVCHWCFYHFKSSVIYYWTDPRQHAIYLFYTMIRKQKRPIHIPASYRTDLKICPKRNFSSLPSSFFRLTYLYTVSSKRFLWSFLAQRRLMAKTFCKIASLFFSSSRVLRHRKYSWQSESTSIFLHKWSHVPCVMTPSNIPSLSILNIRTLGEFTAWKVSTLTGLVLSTNMVLWLQRSFLEMP